MKKTHLTKNLLVALTVACTAVPAVSQRVGHARTETPNAASSNCYVMGDASKIRLWDGRAPGAMGDDPCRDIPYVQVYFPAARSSSRSAVLIIPGGGYDRLTNSKEQAPVAEYVAQTLHSTAFVLYYRLAQKDGTYRYPVPMWDGQRALKLIRAHAQQLGIDPHHVALLGFSAGGHLATTLTLHSATDFGLPSHDAVDAQPGRPDLLGLGYPVISMDPADVPSSGSFRNLLRGYGGGELQRLESYLSGEKNVTARTPPVFLFESMDDAVISPQNSVLFVNALQAQGIPVEAHLFGHGEHGAGLAKDLTEESAWPEMFRRWLIRQQFLAN